jgi:hypothetical protein
VGDLGRVALGSWNRRIWDVADWEARNGSSADSLLPGAIARIEKLDSQHFPLNDRRIIR